MTILRGSRSIGDSEGLARYALFEMIPALGNDGFVAATNVRSPAFRTHPDYDHVTRHVDDAIVHDHDRHVLLMRSGDVVRDDTLVCEYVEATRALARAALEADIVRKLRLADTGGKTRVGELNERLAIGFEYLIRGEAESERVMRIGTETLRRNLSRETAPALRANVKYEVFAVLVRGQRSVPEDKRAVLRWDAEEIDALLIGARQGHARSVLHVDPDAATKRAVNRELGGSAAPLPRGLHYASFIPVPESRR